MNSPPHAELPRGIENAPVAEGGAHVVATVESIYLVLLEVRDGVRDLRSDADDVEARVKDHETRLRAVERSVYKWVGACAVLGAGAGAGFAKLFAAFGG